MTVPLLLPPPIAPSARELAWQDRALCAETDPEAFFPLKGGSIRAAKKVCLRCDVRAECLQRALVQDERYGVWGGKSEGERRKLRKEMGLPEAVAV
ncbi:MAG: WhiB family transcriptional regulator [Streptosporangiaceae bacterium]|nr:WhiB family transcriptional regulator [Streptosporangiaceae bacterium]